MSLAMTVTKHWDDGKALHVVGTLTASGNYPTGGDALPAKPTGIKSTKDPLFMSFSGLSKYIYRLATNKVKIIVPDTGLEVANGAYPAAITADTISFYAVYTKFR